MPRDRATRRTVRFASGMGVLRSGMEPLDGDRRGMRRADRPDLAAAVTGSAPQARRESRARSDGSASSHWRVRLSAIRRFAWSRARKVALSGQASGGTPPPSRPTTTAPCPCAHTARVIPARPLSSSHAADFVVTSGQRSDCMSERSTMKPLVRMWGFGKRGQRRLRSGLIVRGASYEPVAPATPTPGSRARRAEPRATRREQVAWELRSTRERRRAPERRARRRGGRASRGGR